MKKHIAFTLAETLLVIGIIGVVSALTLPNLNSSTGNKEIVAKVKKVYQNLNEAYGRAVAMYGVEGTWYINDANTAAKAARFANRITQFMKISKTCGQSTNQGCFASGSIHHVGNNDVEDSLDASNIYYKYILADGTSIAIYQDEFIVDIDGPNKGANTKGKDIFHFSVEGNAGVVPPEYDCEFNELLQHTYNEDGHTASAWIIKYDNADYLTFEKVEGSKGICKNGNEFTEANPRCK